MLFLCFFLQDFRDFTKACQRLRCYLIQGKHQLSFYSSFHYPFKQRELPIFPAILHLYQIFLLVPIIILSYIGKLQHLAINSNLYSYGVFRSLLFIQRERITNNLCIDNSYLNSLPFLRIFTLIPSHYRKSTSSHLRLSTHW